jgi:hypothetical protein
MAKVLKAEFPEGDIRFLIETVNPSLLSKIDIIKNDPDIIEGMMQHEIDRIYKRMMLINEETVMAMMSPRFLFEVMLRATLTYLQSQTYTLERIATQRTPVFDTTEVVHFPDNREALKYMADMLSSFTKIESFTLPVRVRKGIWRKIRFNDMDIDSLMRFCKGVNEEHRFGFYKRIADLCLFIPRMFPEYVSLNFHYPVTGEAKPRLFGSLGWSAEDYEEEGRRFYKLV